MFTEKSFDVFEESTLEGRMAAIRSEIQPIFQELDEKFKERLEVELNQELYIHIAQHRRRTVYPPENTWSAISTQKRGYKMEPHFQLGIGPTYIFGWLSLIDQPKNQAIIAQDLLDRLALFENLPADMMLSLDHTKPNLLPLTQENLEKGLTRLKNVKKSEFQIGRIIEKTDKRLQNPSEQASYLWETYQELLPIYKIMTKNR